MRFKFLLLSLFLSACSMAVAVPTPTDTLAPVEQIATPVQSVWQPLASGLEKRVYFPPPENEVTKVTALRIDPAAFTFRVHYRPGAPLTIRQWEQALPGAVAFVNANFFDESGNALGLLISEGQAYGTSFVDRGGTFLVQDGQPRLRSNIAEPYAGEPFEQAVQGFPMLMLNGLQAYTDTAQDRFTRRTVIAQDSNGRIVLLVTPLIGLTLLDLSTFLAASDMVLVSALNLDGGGSTLMYLNAAGSPEYIVTSLDPVPAVLAVYPK